MFCFALTSPVVRALCDGAARRACVGVPVDVAVGSVAAEPAALVHDFLPDPAQSCAWLSALAAAGRTFPVIAVLDAPASAALHALAGHAQRFACADIVLATEATVSSLARVFGDVAERSHGDSITRLLQTAWTIDPLLRAMAQRALTMNATTAPHAVWPTESQLLASIGIPRDTFVRHARRAGFRPALRFLHVLRVLAVASALSSGRGTIANVAARYGYSSTGTLRRHFHLVTGLAPSGARHLPLHELVTRMQTVSRRPA